METGTDQGDEDSDTELPINKVGSANSHPITVDLLINDTKVNMEDDTGAAITIISERVWKQ